MVVVEDEPAIRRGVCDALRISGYEVTEAADGELGLDAALRRGVGLVLLDLLLPRKDGLDVGVVNVRFVKPLDTDVAIKALETSPFVLTLEEAALAGGFGSALLEAAADANRDASHVVRLGIPDRFIEHGERGELLADLGLDAAGIATKCRELAERVGDRDVNVNALHQATRMVTTMVLGPGGPPQSSGEEGVEATLRLIADPSLDGVTGGFYNGKRDWRPDEQANDPEARRRLWEESERLTGLA